MKNLKCFFSITLLFVIVSGGCVTPIKYRDKFTSIRKGITLSVLKFSDLKHRKDCSWLQDLFADILITNIVSTDEYKVVLRDRLEILLKEQKLQMTGLINKEKAVNIGNIIGAEAIILGSYAVSDTFISINVKLISIEDSTIISSINITGDLNKFSGLEEELIKKVFNMLSITQAPKKEYFYSQKTKSIRALACNYNAEEFINQGNRERALIELCKAKLLDPDCEMTKKNYSAIINKNKGDNILEQLNLQQDHLKRKTILIEMADFVYKEIKKNGILGLIHERVDIKVTSNYAPVAVVVPMKFWLSENIKMSLKEASKELGGYHIEKPDIPDQSGFKFKLTGDEDVNKYFNNLLINTKFYYRAIFKNNKGESLRKVHKSEIPSFFKFNEVENNISVLSEPVEVSKRYTFSNKNASKIENIELEITN